MASGDGVRLYIVARAAAGSDGGLADGLRRSSGDNRGSEALASQQQHEGGRNSHGGPWELHGSTL